ncbi:hypothetical protein GGR57DRAFT_467120 [Xylariaceae sp. FL1272]|nr:hypothetical protein GGR57DRAFT_467120 [Xylariaceae sp. FL1272]
MGPRPDPSLSMADLPSVQDEIGRCRTSFIDLRQSPASLNEMMSSNTEDLTLPRLHILNSQCSDSTIILSPQSPEPVTLPETPKSWYSVPSQASSCENDLCHTPSSETTVLAIRCLLKTAPTSPTQWSWICLSKTCSLAQEPATPTVDVCNSKSNMYPPVASSVVRISLDHYKGHTGNCSNPDSVAKLVSTPTGSKDKAQAPQNLSRARAAALDYDIIKHYHKCGAFVYQRQVSTPASSHLSDQKPKNTSGEPRILNEQTRNSVSPNLPLPIALTQIQKTVLKEFFENMRPQNQQDRIGSSVANSLGSVSTPNSSVPDAKRITKDLFTPAVIAEYQALPCPKTVSERHSKRCRDQRADNPTSQPPRLYNQGSQANRYDGDGSARPGQSLCQNTR